MAETGNYAALQSLYRGVSPYALAGLSTVPSYGAAAAAAAAAAANGPLFGSGGTVSGPTEHVSASPPTLTSPHTITTAALQTPPTSCSSNMQISPALEMYYRQVQAMTALQKPQENSSSIPPSLPPTLSASGSGNHSMAAQITARGPLSTSPSTTTSPLDVPSHLQHPLKSSIKFEDVLLPMESSSSSPSVIKTDTEASTLLRDKKEEMLHSSLEGDVIVSSETRKDNPQLPLKPTPIVASNSSRNPE